MWFRIHAMSLVCPCIHGIMPARRGSRVPCVGTPDEVRTGAEVRPAANATPTTATSANAATIETQ
jgi:hypothetical protein